MVFNTHELWTIFHGFFLGGIILLSFMGVAEGLWSLQAGMLTEVGVKKSLRQIKIGLIAMTVAAWCSVFLATYRIYAWYREEIPQSPRSRLLADPTKSSFHTFGMEWKEHIAWMVPILFTTTTFLLFRYQTELTTRRQIRVTLFWLLFLGFATALTAGVIGAFINKAAPFV